MAPTLGSSWTSESTSGHKLPAADGSFLVAARVQGKLGNDNGHPRSMTQSSSQAWAFYREVAAERTLWTVEDDVGYPAPKTAQGRRAHPFWSSEARAARIVAEAAAYKTFSPVAIPWDRFCEKWVPGLTEDGLLVGVNWSGPRATGYDMEPEDLRRNVQALIDEPTLTASNSME